MKHTQLKTLCAVCASVLTLSVCPSFAADAVIIIRDKPNKDLHFMGDANGDFKVSVDDAQSVLLSYVQSVSDERTIPAEEQPQADTNLDGVIDIIDASNILRYYCRTLVGDQPLWSEFRSVSEVTGERKPSYETRDYWLESGEVIPVSVQTDTEFLTYGKTGMFIEIGAVSGMPGEYVSVPVYLSGVPLLAGFQLFVNNVEGMTLQEVVGLPDTDLYGDTYFSNQPVTNWEEDWGCSVWVSRGGQNVEFKDGSVVAEFVYQIPADAKSGTVYPLVIDETETKFVTNGSELEPGVYEADTHSTYYQFTILNGAVMVQ